MTKHAIDDDADGGEKLPQQAFLFVMHSILALGAWLGMMFAGYALNPPAAPQTAVLALSIVVPLIAGNIIARFTRDDMAGQVWLTGIIWLLIVSLWILDMPTGPNACLNCGATEKLTRTLFSFPKPSGLIDDNGPFFGTWPAAALLGYGIGAHLVTRRRKQPAN